MGAVLRLAVAVGACAQEPVITPDMPVNAATLSQWLHSGNELLMAWAADFRAPQTRGTRLYSDTDTQVVVPDPQIN